MAINIGGGLDEEQAADPMPMEEEGGDDAGVLAAEAFLKAIERRDPASLFAAFSEMFYTIVDKEDAQADPSAEPVDDGADFL